jgi:hypothetical protein
MAQERCAKWGADSTTPRHGRRKDLRPERSHPNANSPVGCQPRPQPSRTSSWGGLAPSSIALGLGGGGAACAGTAASAAALTNARTTARIRASRALRRWGIEKLRQEVEDGRLARAVRPDQRVDGAAADLEIHPVHRSKASELLGQTAGLEDDVFHAQLVARKPQTRYTLAGSGRRALLDYIAHLERLLPPDGVPARQPINGRQR